MDKNELIGKYFPVLDHGFVALKDCMGDDQAIEESARVSYGAGTRKVNETRGLIRYLIAHKHTTPIEMVVFKFHFGMPIFVARQFIRHRMATTNEYSGRYSLMPQIFYTPERNKFSTQSVSNRQGRSEQCLSEEDYGLFTGRLTTNREEATKLYKDMLGADVAKELARIDLPLSTYTYWYWKSDLHNLFNFLRLRLDSHAQYEIRVFAQIIAGIVSNIVPLAWEAFVDYVHDSSTLSRMDRQLLEYHMQILSCGVDKDTDFDIKEEVEDYGVVLRMSKREIADYWNKVTPIPESSYPLDLSTTKPAQYFEKMIAEHV